MTISTLESAETGRKVRSLMSVYAGSSFEIKMKTEGDWREKLISALSSVGVSHTVNKTEGVLTVKNNTDVKGKQFNFLKYARNELEMRNPFEHLEIIKTGNYALNGKMEDGDDMKGYFEVLEYLRL